MKPTQKIWKDLVRHSSGIIEGNEILLIKTSLFLAEKFAVENKVQLGKPWFEFAHGALRVEIPYYPKLMEAT